MAYNLTDRAKKLASLETIEPQLVFCIDGIDYKFGARIVKVLARYGMDDLVWGQPDLVWGGTVTSEFSRDYISMTGTTNNLSQQLEPDKGASSSTQSMIVRLIDIGGEVTDIISPGKIIPDVLYVNAKLYLAPNADAAFPEDFIQLFDGKITEVKAGPTYIDFTIAHPEELKRSELFPKVETVLTQKLDFNSATIQDIFYQARPDVSSTVQIRYQSGPTIPTIIVSGNLIDVFLSSGVTTAKDVKKAIENNADANQLVTAKITGNANNPQVLVGITSLLSGTEIFVDNVDLFLNQVNPVFKTYVRINDEIIRYTGIDTVAKKLTGITRQSLNTFGFTHEVDDSVFSFYVLGDDTVSNGNAIDLSLWLLLSGPSQTYATKNITSFLEIDPSTTINNAIFFDGIDLAAEENVQIGDAVSVTGAVNGANNFVGRSIQSIFKTDLGSYIVVDGSSLVFESPSTAVITFQSKYNILPDGLNLRPSQVDIAEFKRIQNLFDSSIATYSIYLKETANAKELLNEVILLPSALYNIPRKGKISVAMTAPPLYQVNTQVLNLSTVLKPGSLRSNRSTNRNFYNAIVYKYNLDSLEDKYLKGEVTYSASSEARIAAPVKAYTIKAQGLRDNPTTPDLISRNAKKLLDRYQYGAESYQVNVPFKVGWATEVGDPVVFGDTDMQLVDINTASRSYEPRIFEIQNKEFNIKTGEVRLTIVDTIFDQDKRYAVWAPSTVLGSGSTTTALVMTDSFGTTFPNIEKDKWQNYVGRSIQVHNADWTVVYNTKIDSFSPTNDSIMIVNPALPAPPPSGYLINVAGYDLLDVDDEILKQVYVFWDPTLTIVSGVSGTQFNVSLLDAAKLFVGSLVRVHNQDYSIDSENNGIKVTNIAGTLVTLETDLGFTPSSGQKIEFVGFKIDEGAPYAWV